VPSILPKIELKLKISGKNNPLLTWGNDPRS